MRTLQAPRRYVAYLLRGWAERGDDPAAPVVWRFSLEDPHTGRRRGFASLARLVEVLAQKCGDAPVMDSTDPTDTTEAAPSRSAASPAQKASSLERQAAFGHGPQEERTDET